MPQQDRTPESRVKITLHYKIDPPIDAPNWYKQPAKIVGVELVYDEGRRSSRVHVARQRKDGSLYDERNERYVWGETEAEALDAAGFVPEHLIEALDRAKGDYQ